MGAFDDLIPGQSPSRSIGGVEVQGGRIVVRPQSRTALDDRSRELAIRTVLGEAAGETDEGMQAVAAVIRNRVNAGNFGGQDVPGVVLAKNQFEPFNTAEGRRRMFSVPRESEAFKRASAAVDAVFNDGVDPTNGATFFFAPELQAQLGRPVPSFAKGEGRRIGRQVFFGGQQPQPQAMAFAAEQPAAPADQQAPPAAPSGLFNDLIPAAGAVPAGQSRSEGPAAQPTVGTGEAIARGVAQGLTFNFGDELRGLMEAGGLNPNDPASLRALLTGAARLISGDTEARGRFDAAQAREAAATKQANEQAPVASAVGNVAGALALPVGGLAGAATLGGRALRSAGIGAGFGAASGAGEGDGITDRASRALTGGVIGGAIGGAAAPVVEGITRGVGALASAPINTLRAAVNPEQAAQRAVGRAFTDANRIDPAAANRLTPNELGPNSPASVVDALGAGGRDLARSAANLSSEARDIINRNLQDRFEGQGNRVVEWFRQNFSFPDAFAQQQAIDRAERVINRQAYARAYNAGDRPVWSPELERLTGSPDVVAAIRAAAQNGRSRAIADGLGSFNPGVRVTDGRIIFNTRQGQTEFPNIQFWDYAFRNLRDQANALFRNGRGSEASAIKSLSDQLRNELDRLVPEFGVARGVAQSFFQAENALEAGQRFVTENFSIPQTRAALARMSPNERVLFQDGFISRFVQTLENIPDRADVVRRIYNSATAREKIRVALGPQRADALEALLRVENIMQQSLRAVQSNSTTTQQLVALGLAGATGGGVLGFDPTTSGLAAALTTLGKRGVDRRVAERVAQMLVSNDPAVLNRGIQMLARNDRLMNALRAADTRVARISGSTAPNVGASSLGGVVPSRAEDQQPAVPGPRGQ